MYDIIVLGATFTAAGIAHIFKKNCLILEEGLQAGTEFYGALQYGFGYDQSPKKKEAAVFQEKFLQNNVYSRITQIYPYLQQANILFHTRLVSVQKNENGFICSAYGVEGFCTFEAKQVIDTRSHDSISLSKTYNILIESKETPSFAACAFEKAGMENHYVLRLPIPLDQGYTEARACVQRLVKQFSPSQKLIFSAAIFDYQIRTDYKKTQDGIRRLPSKAFNNPMLAFEAGLEVTL